MFKSFVHKKIKSNSIRQSKKNQLHQICRPKNNLLLVQMYTALCLKNIIMNNQSLFKHSPATTN